MNQPLYLTEKADMYAAGLVLYELCCQLKTEHRRMQKFHDLKCKRQLTEEVFASMPEERDIILNLTEPEPSKRASAVSLLGSKSFQAWSFEAKQ
jgi:serine/threonine protein kinase